MNDSPVIVEFKGVFFGMIWVRISDPALRRSWCILDWSVILTQIKGMHLKIQLKTLWVFCFMYSKYYASLVGCSTVSGAHY